MKQHIQQIIEDSIRTKQAIDTNAIETLETMARLIAKRITDGGTLFLCGNGGSLADAQHLAAELLIRLRGSVERRSFPALCLATDMSSVTACGNDYSFDEIFARPLSGLGRSGDILLGISTSGNSGNVMRAFEVAKENDITCLGFLGGDGGQMLNMCDHAFIAPSKITARIQESHIMAGHIIMECVEDLIIGKQV